MPVLPIMATRGDTRTSEVSSQTRVTGLVPDAALGAELATVELEVRPDGFCVALKVVSPVEACPDQFEHPVGAFRVR